MMGTALVGGATPPSPPHPSGIARPPHAPQPHQHVGFVRPEIAQRLKSTAPDLFADAVFHCPTRGQTQLLHCTFGADVEDSFAARTARLSGVMDALRAEGVIEGWRDEVYPVHPLRGGDVICGVERACATYLGIAQFGVHINVVVEGDEKAGEGGKAGEEVNVETGGGTAKEGKAEGGASAGGESVNTISGGRSLDSSSCSGSGTRSARPTHMWIAKRAADKPTWPGLWDQCVAGGLPVGEDIAECVWRECLEEACIPRAVSERAQAASGISYTVEAEGGKGVFVDYNAVYDVVVPKDFVPSSGDGEVDVFELVPVSELPRWVVGEPGFSPAATLVVLDFMVRHGVVGPASFEGGGSGGGSGGDSGGDSGGMRFPSRGLQQYDELMSLLRLGEGAVPTIG